jgi:hypothetical protein
MVGGEGLVNTTPQPIYPWERDPVPIVLEAGWATGPVWTGAENLTSPRILPPDHPAHSQCIDLVIIHRDIEKLKSPQITQNTYPCPVGQMKYKHT